MEKAKVSSNVMRSILDLDATKHSDPNAQPNNLNNLRTYSSVELRHILKNTYVPDDFHPTSITAQGLIPFLHPVMEQVGTRRVQTDKMRALAPEIEQSKVLVSSSIMSPNDLQDGEYTFSLDSINTFTDDPELGSKITEVYHQMFNVSLNLGIRSYDWIGEIQYSSGAKPILILPPATQEAIANKTVKEITEETRNLNTPFHINQNGRNVFSPGMSSYDEYASTLRNDDFMYSGKPISWMDVLSDIDEVRDAILPSMESYNFKVEDINNPTRRERNALVGLENMILNLRTRLNEGDLLKITENPEIMRFGRIKRSEQNKRTQDALRRKYSSMIHIPQEEMVILEANPDEEHYGHPMLIELPAESVIPICIPGFPKEHLGYFILIDQEGHPLTIENSEYSSGYGSQFDYSNIDAAYEDTFGTNYNNAIKFFGSKLDSIEAGNTIFQQLLDRYVRTRMKGIFGRTDLTVPRLTAIGTALFYRLLARKKTTILYAPPELLHYFAFAYDENGCGLPKTADIQHLLSLRAVYQTASVMAMANDAVEHRTVTLDVDDKNANIESSLDMVKQLFISKNKLSNSIDPTEIIRTLSSNSLTIVPRNIPGLQGMSVEVSNGGIQSVRPEPELIEQLTNLIVSHLDVPPAALNQLAEPEYAKSLVTYNLFFAKKISRYQHIWCEQIRSLVQDYVSFDPIFQRDLLKIIQSYSKKKVADTLPASVKKLKNRNPNQRRTTYGSMLTDVMNNIEVHLPKPDIVVDDTQYEQVRNYVQNLEDLAQKVYPPDIVPGDNDMAQKGLTVLRALWVHLNMTNFIENVGSFKMVDSMNIEDIDDTKAIDFIQTCMNIGQRVSDQQEVIKKADDDEYGGGYGGGDYGSDEYGGDFGDDDGGGNDGFSI